MASAARPTDVAIVGGGIVGCSIALALARRGLHPVVVERDSIGSHASGFAFGELLPWWGRGIPGPLYDFGLRCMGLHHELQPWLHERTGIDTRFRLSDAVSVAVTDADRSILRQRYQWLADQRAPVEWLDGPAMRRLEPRLSDDLADAMRVGEVGVLEAYRYLLATAQAAEQLGATIRHGSVVGIERDGDNAVAVRVGDSVMPCGAVVIAGGPWSAESADWLGCAAPVRPLKGQIVRLRMDGPPLNTYVGWQGSYAITKADGLLWAGTTEEDAGFDDRPDNAGRVGILTKLARVLPGIAEAGIEGQSACLRPLTADGLPIVGRAPNLANVYLATGTGRSGLLLAPGIGEAVADLMVEGGTDWDVEALAAGRFT